MTDEITQSENTGLSRRQLAKGAAWAAPAIALAVATPAAAASPSVPTPLPPGANSWSGGTSIFQNNFVTPNRVQVNAGSVVGFNVFSPPAFDVPAEPGLYISSDIRVRIYWSASAALTPELVSENGWVAISGNLVPGLTGEVTYQYAAGILNGSTNAVALPVVYLSSSSGNPLPEGTVGTQLLGTNILTSGSTQDIGPAA